MATSIVSNDTAATFGNSPQKTGEPLDHATLYSGKALEFDGVGDRLVFSSTNPGEEYTVAAWIYNDATGLRNITDGTGTGQYIVLDAANKPAIYTGTPGWKGGDAITNLEWHRIIWIMSKNGEDFDCYVDGKQAGGTFPSTGGTYTSNTFTGIGALNAETASPSRIFGGKMSDLQIWDKAWDIKDVQYDYKNPETLASVRSGTSLASSNLLRWYPMNDTALTNPQTVVFDAAGTDNTAKKHAATTFLGDELIGDTSFDTNVSASTTGTHWTTSADWSIGSGVATHDGSGSSNLTSSALGLVEGKQYRITITVGDAGTTTARVKLMLGSSSVLAHDGSYLDEGSHSFDATAGGDNDTLIIRYVGGEPTVDDVSVKELGIATGWTDANQQQTIPQTALMDGSVMMTFDGTNDGIMTGVVTDIHTKSFTFGGWFNFRNKGSWSGVAIGGGGNSLSTVRICGTRGLYTVLDGSTAELYTTDLPENEWVHVIITHNISTKSLQTYINGVADTSASQPKTYTEDSLEGHNTNSNQNKIIMFDSMGGSGGRQDGIVGDCVLFTDVAFSASEVTSLYNNGKPFNATKHSQASNLTGYWINNHLSSDGKWKDQVGTNHGTITGGENYIFFQEGVTGNLDTQGFNTNIHHPANGALHLNGSTWAGANDADYANIPYNVDIDGDFSIEMWRKLTRKYQANQDGYILGADNVDFIVVPYAQSSGTLTQVYIRTNSGDTNTITLDTSTDGVDLRPSIYEWFHMVFLRESGTYKVYINGVDLNTGDRETGDSANNFTFRTIAKMTGTSSQAQGFIDELRIYDKALTVAEAGKNYKHGKNKHKN